MLTLHIFMKSTKIDHNIRFKIYLLLSATRKCHKYEIVKKLYFILQENKDVCKILVVT